MRKIPVTLIFVLLTVIAVQAKKIKGKIRLNNGEVISVTFLVPVGLLSGEANYQKLQTKVRYLDDLNNRITIRPDDAKEIAFIFKGEKVRMLSVRDNLQLGTLFSSQLNIFLKLEIDGAVRLFKSYFSQHSPGMYGSSTGMTTGGYTYQIENFVMQKKDGQLFKPRSLSFRKDMSEFFADCPDLVKQIQGRELKKGDLEIIVQQYNDKCDD